MVGVLRGISTKKFQETNMRLLLNNSAHKYGFGALPSCRLWCLVLVSCRL